VSEVTHPVLNLTRLGSQTPRILGFENPDVSDLERGA
jgi:hypothetical protein